MVDNQSELMESVLTLVSTILAIGSVIAPILFGFTIWKMMSIFITKQSYEEREKIAADERLQLRRHIDSMEQNVSLILRDVAVLMERTKGGG